MAEITLESTSNQDIVEALEDAIQRTKAGDRVVLSREEAMVLQQSFLELEEREDDDPAAPPLFFHVPEQSLYFQPGQVAIAKQDASGNMVLVMVTGTILTIEAMQWQMMKAIFEGAVRLQRIASTTPSRIIQA